VGNTSNTESYTAVKIWKRERNERFREWYYGQEVDQCEKQVIQRVMQWV
jgi:hypothetical protein